MELLDRLKSPALSESQDLVCAWKDLRALLVSEASSMQQRHFLPIFSKALHDQRYHQDVDLAQQLLLTIPAAAAACTRAVPVSSSDSFLSLLKPLVELADRHTNHDNNDKPSKSDPAPLQQLSAMAIQSVIITSPKSEKQDQPPFLIRYLKEEMNERGFFDAATFSSLVIKLFNNAPPSNLAQRHIVRQFWELVGERDLPVSVLQVLVRFLSKTISESIGVHKQKLSDNQIYGILRLVSYNHADCAAMTLLVNVNLVDQAMLLVLRCLSTSMQEGKNDQVVVDDIKLLGALMSRVHQDAICSWTVAIANTLVDLATQHFGAHSIHNATLAVFRSLIQNGSIENLLTVKNILPYLFYCISKCAILACVEASAILQEMIRHDAAAVGASALSMTQGPKRLTACMECHPEKYPVQDSLCAALEALTLTKDDRLRDEMLESAGDGGNMYMNLIIDALERFPGRTSIVRSTCRALIGLLPYIQEDNLWRKHKPLCACIEEALRAIRGNCSIAEEAVVDAWFHLCNEHDVFRFEMSSNLPILFDSMRENMHNMVLNGRACQIIDLTARFQGASFAKDHPHCVEYLVNSSLHPSASTRHVVRTLTTLTFIAGTSGFCETLSHQSVEENILRVAQTHVCDPTILAKTMDVLSNAAVASRFDPALLLSDSVFQFILWSMANYTCDKKIQSSACRLLYNHLAADIARQHQSKMSLDNDTLTPLLLSAAEQFPELCGQRAQFILLHL